MNDKPSKAIAQSPQMSSPSFTLQRLNKETQKKELAAEAAKTRCRICFKETAPVPRCFGHGGGGGGSNDGDGAENSSDERAAQDDGTLLSHSKQSIAETNGRMGLYEARQTDDTQTTSSNEKSFDPEVIAELITKELLLIQNDRESKALSIELQCAPSSLTLKEQRQLKKYMNAIIKEFNEFKKENKLSDDCLKISKDDQGNIISIRITMPTLALHDAFIQRLANNLVPTPSPKPQLKDDVKNEQHPSLKPLSMEPKLTKQKEIEKDKVDENEKQLSQTFSPFKLIPW